MSFLGVKTLFAEHDAIIIFHIRMIISENNQKSNILRPFQTLSTHKVTNNQALWTPHMGCVISVVIWK